jgi:hypothetical protein
MRDVFAGLLAIALLFAAASLSTTLQRYRRRRARARDSERALGRTIVAEIPAAADLVLFSEDDVRFHYGDRSIDKDLIAAVRLLVNGAPIAVQTSSRYPQAARPTEGGVEDQPDGIARDRWDVEIDTISDRVIVECGAIRERVSQELARAVFDAVKRELQRRDHHSASGAPPR